MYIPLHVKMAASNNVYIKTGYWHISKKSASMVLRLKRKRTLSYQTKRSKLHLRPLIIKPKH